MSGSPPPGPMRKQSAPDQNRRELSWVDLSEDEENAFRLTYSKLVGGGDTRQEPLQRRRFKSLEGGEEEEAPAAGSTIDVTSLLRPKHKKVPVELPVSPEPPAAFLDVHHTMPAAFRCIDVLDDGQLSADDLNLLVNTLSQLTASADNLLGEGKENLEEEDEFPASGGFPPPIMSRTASDACTVKNVHSRYNNILRREKSDVTGYNPFGAAPDGAYDGYFRNPYGDNQGYVTSSAAVRAPQMLVPPEYPEDASIVVNGHNLTYWRRFFMSLAYSSPASLQAYVASTAARPSRAPPVKSPPVNNAASAAAAAAKRPPPSQGRFKQIARGKSTREYMAYIQAIPKEARQPGVDPETPRVEGSSWREFQAEVRAWKRMLHRKYEYLEALQQQQPPPQKRPQQSPD